MGRVSVGAIMGIGSNMKEPARFWEVRFWEGSGVGGCKWQWQTLFLQILGLRFVAIISTW